MLANNLTDKLTGLLKYEIISITTIKGKSITGTPFGTKSSRYLMPCFINPKSIESSLYINQDMLHQGCLCIEPNNVNDIDKIKSCIIKNIEFIRDNSSKRSGGWINLSSRTLYEIPLD